MVVTHLAKQAEPTRSTRREQADAAVDIVAPVPWGRTLAEYRAMFALSSPEDGCRILDVAAGPASFAAEWTAGGGRAVACDPLYAGSGPEIAARLAAARDAVREVLAAHPGRFAWRSFADPEALVEERRRAAERFLADLAPGRTAGRYLAGTLPRLPFADRAFDLALCSHFLFLYSAAFDAAFSNFGPLNCVEDLPAVARQLHEVLRPGGVLVASVIGRVCPWE